MAVLRCKHIHFIKKNNAFLMLLTLIMNLGMAAGIAVIPVPPSPAPIVKIIGSPGFQQTSAKYEKYKQEQVNDSELIAIVEFTLKTAIL